MLLGTGCAMPGFFSRADVACDLEGRMCTSAGLPRSACEPAVPDAQYLESGLTEQQAVALGLWNNPAYQELLVDLDIAEADVIAAHQLMNPDIYLWFPLSAKQFEMTLWVPLDAMLLRPMRVNAAQLESNRIADRLVQDGMNTVRDIRVAYADLVLAERSLELARMTERLQAEILRIAEARLKAGEVAELDIIALRLQVRSAEVMIVQRQRERDLAEEQLRFVVGLGLTDVHLSTAPNRQPQPFNLDVDALVSDALASRPDLWAIDKAIAAASERERLTHYDYFKFFVALPDINSKGDKGFEAGPGMRMTLPIFHHNQGAKARAQAEVERLMRQYDRLASSAALEVRQAYAQLTHAQSQYELWHGKIRPQAEEAAHAARESVKEEGVAILLVLETSRQLYDARQQEITATADVQRAWAELERSVGRCLAGGDSGEGEVVSPEEVLPELAPPELAPPDFTAPEELFIPEVEPPGIEDDSR